MTKAFNIFSAQLPKFVTPGTNGGRGDVVILRDGVDRTRPRFAKDFYYLPFRKVWSLHSKPSGLIPVVLELLTHCCRRTRNVACADNKNRASNPNQHPLVELVVRRKL